MKLVWGIIFSLYINIPPCRGEPHFPSIPRGYNGGIPIQADMNTGPYYETFGPLNKWFNPRS